jgi:hypothetical protein
MTSVAPLILFVLGLAFAAGLVGTLARPLGLFLGLAFLAFGVLVGRSRGSFRFRPLLLVLGLAALAGGIILFADWPFGRINCLLAICALLVGTDVLFRAFGRIRADLYPAAVVALLAACFFVLIDYSPPFCMMWQRGSLAVTEFVGACVGRPLKLGPSCSGFNLDVVLVLTVLAVSVFSGARNWWRLALSLVYLAAVALAYLVAMTFLPSYGETAEGAEVAALLASVSGPAFAKEATGSVLGFLSRHVPWNMPLALLVFQLPAIWMVAERVKLRPARVLAGARNDLLCAAGLALALLAAVAVQVVRAPERPRMTPAPRVVLYEKGYLNWSKPDFDSFGEYSSGMLGRLPVFLRQLGFDAALASSLDNGTLRDARIAVVVNPWAMLSRPEHATLWEFVRRGGSLLLVGDHTWRNDKGEDTLNDLLSPSDIRFHFDSATYHIGGWLYEYGFTADAVFHRMRDDMNQPGVGIGASLDLRGRAEPLLFGVYGYSDVGVVVPRPDTQYLGDRRYTPGEQLGDVVLAAQQNFGAGRVVVFGDTTGFFNLLMLGSHQTVSRIFGKLASPPVDRWYALQLVVSGSLFLIGCVLLAACRRRSLLALLVVSLSCGFGISAYDAWASAPIDLVPSGDIAYVDGSHGGRFSQEIWRDDGLAGLYLNLMRNDIQPLSMESFSPERLSRARMLFVIAPAQRYSEREVDAIEHFIRRGGYVVVCAGAGSADAVQPLLSRRRLCVRNKPLGPFMTLFPPISSNVRFCVAFGVEDAETGTRDALVWYDAAHTTAVMMERLEPEGASGAPRGGLLLVGDDQFLLNKNLETDKGPPIMENVNFMKWLVRHQGELAPKGSGP